MNEYDRKNLEFLLTASQDVLRHWYDSVDEDDRVYASELLTAYGKELTLKSILLNDHVTDVSQAANLLKNLFKYK